MQPISIFLHIDVAKWKGKSCEVYLFEYTYSSLLVNAGTSLCCRELLVDFYKTSNGRKPTQIIVFRYHKILLAM